MRILFIHEGFGQFQTLHQHLNATGLAESWFLCSTGVHDANKDRVPNLVPFRMVAENPKSYFYTRGLEARTQRSFLLREAIGKLIEHTPIDVIVAHGSGGFPLQIFDSFDIPVISYIEFPSFTAHGYDARYPQPEYAAYRDRLFEMTSYHQAVKSDMTIVPSEYARRMFPACLHERIVAQMEGFDIVRKPSRFKRKDGVFHIGFAARDLSSAKGFEQFVLIAKAILAVRPNVRFVFCGSPKVLYSYEGAFLQAQFPDEATRPASFMQYVLEREGITLGPDAAFEHVDFAGYEDFASYIEAMDLFLYPLQFGSANWGLFELLFRARTIIASDRCFISEVIRNGYNGYLCKYDDIPAWVRLATAIIDDPAAHAHIGETAAADAQRRYHVKAVAERYLSIFAMAIQRRKLGLSAAALTAATET